MAEDDFPGDDNWLVQTVAGWMTLNDSATPVLACLTDAEGSVLAVNGGAVSWNLVDHEAAARGMSLHELMHSVCVDPDCVLSRTIAETVAARHEGKVAVLQFEDARLARRLEVLSVPVFFSELSGCGHLADATITYFHDLTSQKRSERWLSETLDQVNQELRQRTVALERSDAQYQRSEATVRRTESELRLLSAALMTAQEMERKRIATDLHDSIGQSLSALSFGVGVALDGARGGNVAMTCDILEKLSDHVKKAVAEVRRIAMDLRPATLDDLGIVGTLSWFFREFRAIHGGLSLVTEITLEEGDVSPALRTTIFRVVQEAVNNVVKHAQAREVHARLWREGSDILLEIGDDGNGFHPAETRQNSGMGLKGMRDRVEFSGGAFRLESAPGKGTRILSKWPAESR